MGWGQRVGLAVLLVCGVTAFAADGDPDPTFSGDGLATTTWPNSISSVRVAVAADGSVFHASTVQVDIEDGANLDFAVAKFRANGTLDTSFGFLGRRIVGVDVFADGDDSLLGVFPLPDGSVLLAGVADLDPATHTYAAPALVRLTPQGNVDTTFGVNGRVVMTTTPWANTEYLELSAVVRQADGKLVFAGDCWICAGETRAVAVRVTAAGALDTGFGTAGWFQTLADGVTVGAVALDARDRLVLGGVKEPEDEPYDRPWLARITAAGTLDATFGGGTGVSWLSQVPTFNNDWRTRGMAIDREGSIVLALGNGAGAIVRANANGSLDTTFASNGFRSMERENGSDMAAVAIRSDRRILVAGYIRHTGGGLDHYIGRLLPNGSFDTSFDANGVIRIEAVPGENDSAKAIAFSGGRPVIAGHGGADYDVATVVVLQSNQIFVGTFEP